MTTKNIKTENKIIEYFDEATIDYSTWDDDFNMHFGYYKFGMNPFDLPKMLNQMNAEVLKRLGLETESDALILDLGCGVGTTSRFLANHLPNAEFYGATLSSWQIEFGRNKNLEMNLANRITLLREDYTSLPFTEGCANAAFALESSCYAKGRDKGDFIKELYRVLKKRGRFVIADGFLKHPRKMPKYLNWIYKNTTQYWALDDFAEIDLFVEKLKEVGFKNLKIEEIGWNVAPSVLHIPKTVFKYYWNRFANNEKAPISEWKLNNVLAPIFGLLLGLHRRAFGYYFISGEK